MRPKSRQQKQLKFMKLTIPEQTKSIHKTLLSENAGICNWKSHHKKYGSTGTRAVHAGRWNAISL
jgi:hypothetical protein